MRVFVAVLALVWALVPWSPRAGAGEPTPEAFLAGIHAKYVAPKGKNAPGVDLRRASTARRLFEASTARLILRDAAAARGEVGALDFDVFVGGQDHELTRMPVFRVESAGNGRAVVIATGVNELSPGASIRYELVRADGEWRIHDMRWNGVRQSLRELLKKP